jgi:pyruvate formate lyase activating enzyme
MTVGEVVDEVSRDALFYRSSGGGVTFSGGEPTAQPEFVRACAERCGQLGIHTALDTCGYAQRHVFAELLPVFDLVLYDIKHMDPERHRELTGVGNDLVLRNLRYIDAAGVPVWIRLPLIPGCNDARENIERLADLLNTLRCVERVSVLSYNTAAGARYPAIGKAFDLEVPDLSADRERQIVETLAKTGVEVDLRR